MKSIKRTNKKMEVDDSRSVYNEKLDFRGGMYVSSLEQKKSYANWPDHYGDPDWFVHDRFGMFIHFGLYSPAARHEWVMKFENIHPEDYRKYFANFNPDLFDAGEWARYAKDAGMKYVVITTKHHDGFALWDSKVTDYKITNTAFKRDLLREFIDALRLEGLKVGLYHSLIDWNHSEFPIDHVHPQSGDKEFRKAAENRDMEKYVPFLHEQVRELLSDYGRVDYLWFDFSYPDQEGGKGASDWHSEELENLVRELQPHILLNDRLDLNRGIVTPEQYQPYEPLEKDGKPILWEACQTMNGSWGYHRDNLDWKSAGMLIKTLIDTVAKNGNLLLNVGPNGRGRFDHRTIERLEAFQEWMQLHKGAIYGAGHSEFKEPIDCRYTQKGNKLYLHIFSWPFAHIHLEGLAGWIEYAQFLHDGSEVLYSQYNKDQVSTHMSVDIAEGSAVLNLPIQEPNVIVPVIEITLNKEKRQIKYENRVKYV